MADFDGNFDDGVSMYDDRDVDIMNEIEESNTEPPGSFSITSTSRRSTETNNDDDDIWTPRKTFTKKAKKPKRKSTKKPSKSAILKGVPAPRYPKVPEDHFFKLPPELRNRIYEYVLDSSIRREPKAFWNGRRNQYGRQITSYIQTFHHETHQMSWSIESSSILRHYGVVPKYVKNGDTNEPALLRVCPQMREETLQMYYGKSSFKLYASPKQLEGMHQWLTGLKEKYGRKENQYIIFGSLTLCLHSMDWADIGHLLPLAKIVREYIWQWDDVIEWHGRHQGGLAKVVQGVVDLGRQAYREDWHPDWLGVKFEEWVEQMLDSKMVLRGMKRGMRRCELQERGIEPLRKGLPGDWYATGEVDEEDQDSADFSRASRARIPTSDRVTRSQRRAEAGQNGP